MKKRIILVGCGNIGSRHLQAIAKLSYDIQVDIVEPNNDAVSLAKTRLNPKLHLLMTVKNLIMSSFCWPRL